MKGRFNMARKRAGRGKRSECREGGESGRARKILLMFIDRLYILAKKLFPDTSLKKK